MIWNSGYSEAKKNQVNINLVWRWQLFGWNFLWCTIWNTNTIRKSSLLHWELINFTFNLKVTLESWVLFITEIQKVVTKKTSVIKYFTMIISSASFMSSSPYNIFSVPFSYGLGTENQILYSTHPCK